jgi:integrase
MPFKLYAPGARNGNPFWVARISVGGRRTEVSTKKRDKAAARRFAQDLERQLLTSGPPRPGQAITFTQAADLYVAFRDPQKADRGRIARLKLALGPKLIGDIHQADLVAAADLLLPDRKPATRNREVMRMAAAILHYAAENKYCPWLHIKLFKEPVPSTRAVPKETATAIVNAAPEGRKRLLLLWLFCQGTRISQTLGVTWADIDLPQQTFRLYDKKARSWHVFPLRPEVFEELAAIPEGERGGRLWPWTQKTGVYRWLRPLVRELGVAFTPHMGRHSLGTWLNESGAGLKTIMAALGHKDAKSSIRYQAADIDMVRAATKKMGGFWEDAPEKRRNPVG